MRANGVCFDYVALIDLMARSSQEPNELREDMVVRVVCWSLVILATGRDNQW